ncbi:DUF2202 domain-containing protein [Pseudolysinimonas sp.]|uniref:DUF2202 domain-containing protein n=1 Tax=Pseudolysinimonas sp. TaxID=2680009 RepID=UPI003F7E4402
MLALALLATATGCSAREPGSSPTTSAAATSTRSPAAATPADETARLQYLIEEEKLAHDVYQQFGQLWGEQVFGNILASEVTHQQLLVPLLTSLGLPDPRSSTAGEFSDPELQRMYDRYVHQGSVSVTEAYKVGVAIEQRDIADLSADLKTATDPATTTVLQRLLVGSRNHLQALEAHLS